MALSGLDTRPYDPTSLGYYFLLVSMIAAIIGFDAHSVSQEIRDGEITQHVLKPFSYMWMKFWSTFPNAFIKFVVGSVIIVILFLLGFQVSTNLLNCFLFLLTLILAILGNYLIYFLVGLASFWTQQVYGFGAFVSIASSLVSGRLIPVDLLPSQIVVISNILPFRYLIFFPTEVFLGKLNPNEIFTGIAIQTVWVGILYIVSLLVWRLGQKEMEAIGI